MKTTKCDQLKCAYNIQGGCRACECCGAEPHEINENCDVCWNCKSDEGLLRWDNSKEPTREDVKQFLKDLLKQFENDDETKTKKEKVTPYVS